MPKTDLFGRTIPVVGATAAESDGPPNIQTVMENFSNSVHAPVLVASRSAADQLAATAPSTAFPLFVWRTDINALHVKETRGAAWDFVGGRPHGLTANLYQNNLPAGQVQNLGVSSITRQSVGWSLSSDSTTFTLPGDGLYLFCVDMTISGKAADLGRVFVEFVINGNAYRNPCVADDNMSATVLRPCAKGQTVKVNVYHAAGGTRSLTAGELTIAQILSPSW